MGQLIPFKSLESLDQVVDSSAMKNLNQVVKRKKFRGGTIIAENVTKLSTHERRIQTTDGYRPRECPECHCTRMHSHGKRQRLLRDGAARSPILIAIYRCDGCSSIWRVLPRFIAVRLWRRWSVVEQVLEKADSDVPPRTQRHWRALWRSSAVALVALLGGLFTGPGCAAASMTSINGTRQQLVQNVRALAMVEYGYDIGIDGVAALIHRQRSRIRLM